MGNKCRQFTNFAPKLQPMAKYTPEQKMHKQLQSRFSKATKEYSLLNDGDKILVALSGGKDSLTLLQLLAERSRIHKPAISIIAAHVSMVNIPYKSDIGFLQRFCEGLQVPFHHIESSFAAETDTKRSPCFLCSWNRRKALFELAQREGCNKIALGHNMDDFIETLLMNITFQGAFSAMAPAMKMDKFPITIIRPLCLTKESDVEEYAALRAFPPQVKNCPYENDSNRKAMKDMLAQLTRLNPEAHYNIWGAMSNIQQELLPPKTEKKQ